MTDRRLLVLMNDEIAGRVTRPTTGGRLTFTYEPPYVAKRVNTPLSVSMPRQVSSHSDGAISPWLWGLLPDNSQVLRRWVREFRVSETPFALLSTPLGEDCPGAVRLVPEERFETLTSAPKAGDVHWLSRSDVAARLKELRRDQTAWLGERKHRGRFSLAGAQAKTALLLNGDQWGDPHGAVATSHILKPAIEGLDQHDLNEHLCLSAMRVAGMAAVRTWIERFGDESAIVVARYDRASQNGQQLRLHQEDLCQALGIHPANKYQNQGGPGPEEIAALFRRAMPRKTAREATVAFLDALLWNWLIAGTDAHAKNYSILLMGNDIRLAPFYDVASSLPYGWASQESDLAMKFGSRYDLDPYSSPWPHLAKRLQLSEERIRERARHLIEVAPHAFDAAARDPSVQELKSDLPDRMTALVADRARKCARYID